MNDWIAVGAIASFISSFVTLALVIAAFWQIIQGRKAIATAQESTKAARDAVQETARTRIDDQAPRIIALMEAPQWPPHVHLDATEFVFPRDEDKILQLLIRGVLINEGKGTARVRLDGEAQFIEGESGLVGTGHLSIPRQVGAANHSEHILQSGDKALFLWSGQHKLSEWADAYTNPEPPNPHGACFLTVTVFDSFGGVIDHIYFVMAGRPIEPTMGALGHWQLTSAPHDNLGLSVYPTQRTYRHEGWNPLPPPWQETYSMQAK